MKDFYGGGGGRRPRVAAALGREDRSRREKIQERSRGQERRLWRDRQEKFWGAGAELGKIFGVGCNLLTQKLANCQRRRNGQSDKQTCAAGAVEVGADNTVCPLNFTPTV